MPQRNLRQVCICFHHLWVFLLLLILENWLAELRNSCNFIWTLWHWNLADLADLLWLVLKQFYYSWVSWGNIMIWINYDFDLFLADLLRNKIIIELLGGNHIPVEPQLRMRLSSLRTWIKYYTSIIDSNNLLTIVAQYFFFAYKWANEWLIIELLG